MYPRLPWGNLGYTYYITKYTRTSKKYNYKYLKINEIKFLDTLNNTYIYRFTYRFMCTANNAMVGYNKLYNVYIIFFNINILK